MSERKAHDFYATDVKDVHLLKAFIDRVRWPLLTGSPGPSPTEGRILYPCAGGVRGESPAPYPVVFGEGETMDIRPDANVAHIGDFLQLKPKLSFSLVIDNPPFKLYRQFVEQALQFAEVAVFLLPMQSREPRKRTYAEDVAWWAKYRPTSIVTHPRLHFSGAKSSAFQEYAHFFWVRDSLGHMDPIQLYALDDGATHEVP